MAESGRTPAPRTCRHGHSRPPLSAARRTRDSSGQARLANLFDQAAPAPPRAALHLAHPSDRPRSDPDHAAARHASPKPRTLRSVTAAGSPRVSAVCRRPHRFLPGTVVPLRGVAHRIVHRAGERGTVWTETRDSGEQDSLRRRRRRAHRPARPRLSQARSAQAICTRRRWPTPQASRRAGEAGVDPRPVEPLGFVHLGRLVVVSPGG